jgi:hypothetical protein
MIRSKYVAYLVVLLSRLASGTAETNSDTAVRDVVYDFDKMSSLIKRLDACFGNYCTQYLDGFL